MGYILAKDSYECDFCGVEISWEETHPTRGDMWGCEKCGKTFCSQCLKDRIGENGYDRIMRDNDLILCPDCAVLEQNGDENNGLF